MISMPKKREKGVNRPLLKRPVTWIVAGVLAVGVVAGGGGEKEDPRKLPDEPDKSIVQTDVSDQSKPSDVSDPQTNQPENTSTDISTQEPDTSTKKEVPEQNPVETKPEEPKPQTQKPADEKPQKNTNSAGKERRDNWSSGAYLGSTESDKYHDYECRAAKKILAENEIWFSSEDQAKDAGYSRCGICW